MAWGQGTAARFLELRWINRQRITGYSAVLLLVSVAATGFALNAALGPDGSDFLAFWSAGKLVLGGNPAAAYDLASTGAIQAQVGRSDVFAFVNPPPFLLALWPLGGLDFAAAWSVWVAATYLLWLGVTRALTPRSTVPLAAYPGALIAATHAQTGFITSALQAGVARMLDRRPIAAGLCLGALVIKPHLAVLFPFALAADRRWKAFFAAGAGVVLWLAMAWALLGSETMIAYRKSWQVSRVLMAEDDPVFFLRQATVYAQFRAWGMPVTALLAQVGATLAAITITWRSSGRSSDLAGKLALIFALTPLATPYLFNYDLPFLVVPTLWLIAQMQNEMLHRFERAELLGLYLAPALARAMSLPLGVNLTPLVCVWMAWRVWQRLSQAPIIPDLRLS
ncbi:glycosyltransferase family 87 protein [Novosphingobium sp.]|uniref:glycosyltransferase family 87 protein n=1 Tax=Novosphingobium sp. TaxID=1874826 RepID=UPI0025D5EB0C|nr:glycosyltransferase family 87 protein [Novosphingobium sp.]